jgi:hypothetical protein
MPTDVSRSHPVSRGIVLEYLTVGWNALECLIAIAADLVAGSVALVGFGVDSAIESGSGAVLLWRLYSERRGKHIETTERRALKLVGLSLLLLAAYVAAVWKRWIGNFPTQRSASQNGPQDSRRYPSARLAAGCRQKLAVMSLAAGNHAGPFGNFAAASHFCRMSEEVGFTSLKDTPVWSAAE